MDWYDLNKVTLGQAIRDYNGSATKDVNCTDCANLVVSFANIVGVTPSLQVGRMTAMSGSNPVIIIPPGAPSGYPGHLKGFLTNPYCAIGRPAWTAPAGFGSPGWNYSYHEVAWKNADSVYDACLKVDSDGNPDILSTSHTPQLPTGMVFDNGGPSTPADDYREDLAKSGTDGYGSCQKWSSTFQVRDVK